MPLMKVKGLLVLELKCFFKSVLISKSLLLSIVLK